MGEYAAPIVCVSDWFSFSVRLCRITSPKQGGDDATHGGVDALRGGFDALRGVAHEK